AGTIGTDETETIPAHEAHRQPGNDRALIKAHCYVLELSDQLTGALAGVETQLHVAEAVETLRPLDTQPLHPLDPSLVPSPPGLDSLADPDSLLSPELLEAPPRHILRGELLLLARFVRRKVARI